MSSVTKICIISDVSDKKYTSNWFENSFFPFHYTVIDDGKLLPPLSQNDCFTFLLTTPQGNVETREPEMKRDSRSWTQTIRKTSKTLGKTIGKVLLIIIFTVNEQTREWRVSIFEHVFWMISSLYICLELNFNNKQVFLYVKVQLVKTEIGVSTWFVFLRFYIFLETISPMISPLQFLPRHHTGGNSQKGKTLERWLGLDTTAPSL